MKFEKPQKGNPHRLTINQHVFPRTSINRFERETGLVDVFSYRVGKVVKVRSDNDLFCAKRAWDQRTEAGIGKHIEDRFQSLVRGILTGAVSVIGHFEKIVVEEFFSLWRSRQKFRVDGLADVQFDRGGEVLTIDQQEALESKHVAFMRDGVMPGRLTAGIHVFGYLNALRHANQHTEWGIVRSGDGEFIVPDCFQDMMIVPVSPKISIIADQPNSLLTRSEVAVLNQMAIDRSNDYYFARNFSACPIYRDHQPRLQRIFAR